ncbi:hypothetical protein ACP6NG_17970 [Brevibacterium casei]|uniref:hypothetical protein n=1 Tax=Brevibacterium casei TaxID=33889 RepID=UPI003F801F72
MDLEISKEETLEQIVNDQREEIEQLKVARAQLQVAVRKLTNKEESDVQQEKQIDN